jgi:multidrug efflux pump subunit AcrA (membrane-fusion protein)
VVKEEPPAPPEIDMGSGYTAAQIAEMRSQQEKTIRDLQFQVKMAEADYKIKQTEMADGNIYAEIDGTVVSLLTPEEALQTQQPLMKVSGGGGFYVEGSISELQKETLLIGQEVTVNDWNTGMVYTGLVESVADYPLSGDNFMGNGNPNVSYYPFTVFIDGSADLQAGSYVSVVYSTATSESGIYLENPYLRTENGQSYVYVQGADGLLEKRFVTIGRSLWGSYTEILEGLSENDLIAFPYGKAVKEGAPTQESDYSTLYG